MTLLHGLVKEEFGKGSGLKLKPCAVLNSRLCVTINTEEVLGYHQKHKESYVSPRIQLPCLGLPNFTNSSWPEATLVVSLGSPRWIRIPLTPIQAKTKTRKVQTMMRKGLLPSLLKKNKGYWYHLPKSVKKYKKLLPWVSSWRESYWSKQPRSHSYYSEISLA